MTPTQQRLAAAGLVLGGLVVFGTKRKRRCSNTYPLRFLERMAGGASPNDAVPIVVVGHSLGGNPEGYTAFASNLGRPARIIIPEGPIKTSSGHAWSTRASTTRDQETLVAQLRGSGEKVAGLIRELLACKPHAGPVIVTGSSQGGHMAYLMASQHAGLVDGAVAVAGWLPEELRSSHMAPTVGIHGELDDAVPFERTAEFANEYGFPLFGYPAGHYVSSGMRKKWYESVRGMLGQ